MSEPTQGHDDAEHASGAAPGPESRPPRPSDEPSGTPEEQHAGAPEPPAAPLWGPPAPPYGTAPQPPFGPPYQESAPGTPDGHPGYTPQPFARTAAANRDRKRLLTIGGAVVGGVLVILLVIWLVNLIVGGTGPKSGGEQPPATSQSGEAPTRTGDSPSGNGTPPAGARTISALDAKQGQCFWGYPNDSNSELVVVDCGSTHSAQLVNVFYYQKDETFPGQEKFKTKGRELCRTATLSDDVDSLNLRQRFAYPSQKSWDAGDRRVDCIIFSEDGNILSKSLTK